MPQYMLMFLGTDEEWETRSKEERQKAYAAIGAWWEELSKQGVIKSGEELQPRRSAITVKRVNGQMKVFDGPFIESKEHVGGYALIQASDLDEALRVAKSWPGGDVEVRPIVER